jgi:hypothetical protein
MKDECQIGDVHEYHHMPPEPYLTTVPTPTITSPTFLNAEKDYRRSTIRAAPHLRSCAMMRLDSGRVSEELWVLRCSPDIQELRGMTAVWRRANPEHRVLCCSWPRLSKVGIVDLVSQKSAV